LQQTATNFQAYFNQYISRNKIYCVLPYEFYASFVDDYYLSICEQVMRESGTMDQTIMHCIFVGPAGVGKSSLLKRLLRMKLDPKRTSTQAIEKSIRVEVIRNVSRTAARMSGLDWKRIDDLKTQASGLIGQLSLQNEEHSIASGPNKHLSTKQEKAKQEEKSTVEEDSGKLVYEQTGNISEANALSENTVLQSDESKTLTDLKFSETINFFRHALKEKGVSELKQHINSSTLYLTDSGGQPEFQELLPALVVGPCVFFVVFPLNKNLKKKYEVEYVKPDEQKCIKKYSSSLTVQEDILRSLASIASTKYKDKDGNEVKPRVMLVATFKDKVPVEKVRQKRLKQLNDLIRDTDAYRQGMIIDASETQMVFTINNVSNKEAEQDSNEIRDAFQVIADGFKVRTPSPWLIFSILVQHVHANDSVISKQECFKVAKECGIRSDIEFEAALQFLHKQTGILHHYMEPRELSTIVIQNPQHLFSRVNQLVERTFTFEGTRSSQCTEEFKRGIFKQTDYEALTKGSTSKLNPSMLLKLLKHLNVIVPLDDGKKYFMPCAIAHLEDTGKCGTKLATIPPLLITFKSGYCPMGLFGALVACIASKQVGKCTLNLDESQIHRDQICFQMGLHKLLLQIKPTYIYIQVIPKYDTLISTEICSMCNSVRDLIEKSITKACETLHYSDSARYCLSFVCQCAHGQVGKVHHAQLRNDPVQGRYFLCSQSKVKAPVNPECHVWLPEVSGKLH